MVKIAWWKDVIGGTASRLPNLTSHSRAYYVLLISLVAWVGALGFGLRTLLLFSNTPGTQASPPSLFPGDSPIRLSHDRASLLVFIHPQCACSGATLSELEQFLTCCGKQVETTIFVYQPSSIPREWVESQSGLWPTVRRLPGTRVVRDLDAVTARLFGAHISGQTLLYDVNGRLAFSGGITASRGHSGDNDGREALTAIVGNRVPRHRHTPVFGCALYGER